MSEWALLFARFSNQDLHFNASYLGYHIMKPLHWLPLGIVTVGLTTFAGAVQLGDSREAVLEEMGQPTGEIGAGNVMVLFFERGEIHLRDSQVSAIELVSAEEFAARQSALAEEMARLDAARAERNARLEAEGYAEREARKNDPAFVQLNASKQLAYWRTFAARYPMVPIADELTVLRERFTEEQRLYELEVAHEQRMADLEQRLAEAEQRAERAERLARNRPTSFPWFGRSSRYQRNGLRRDSHFEPHTTPPADDIRAQAMASYDNARREIYSQSDARP